MYKWPVKNPIFSQHFGDNRSWYVAHVGQQGHNGDDIAVPPGTPVHAAADGTIVFEGNGKNGAANYPGWMGDYAGICVLIKHSNMFTGYAHLSRTVVNTGQVVKQGQLIGYSGATGLTMGSTPQPHLHFEFLPLRPNFQNGFAGRVNPASYITSQEGEDDMSKTTRDIDRILAYAIGGRNGFDGRSNALGGKDDAELKKNHEGKETNAEIWVWYNSAEGKKWREVTLPAIYKERDSYKKALVAANAKIADLQKQLQTPPVDPKATELKPGTYIVR